MLVEAPKAPLMLMMRIPAACIMSLPPRAEAASCDLGPLRRPPANFEFRIRARRRRDAHHEHQRDHRNAAEEGLKGFALDKLSRPQGPHRWTQQGSRDAVMSRSIPNSRTGARRTQV